MSNSATPNPSQSNITQHGVQLRLAVAKVKLTEAQNAYDRNPDSANRETLLAAETEFRSLRVPLMNLAVNDYCEGV